MQAARWRDWWEVCQQPLRQSARSRGIWVSLSVALTVLVLAPPAQAGFGIESFAATATTRDGRVASEAGSHPFEYTLHFSINASGEGEPEGELASLAIGFPPGLVGYGTSIGDCALADFDAGPRCPPSTQVGILEIRSSHFENGNDPVVPIYNLDPPLGAAAALGFGAAGFRGIELLSLGGDGGLEVTASNLPDLGIHSLTETIWGVPADPGHDAERTCFESDGSMVMGCSLSLAPVPFLTLPTSCSGPLETTLTVLSHEAPASPVSATTFSRGDDGLPLGLTGCERLPFEPTFSVRPDSGSADAPTGLQVDLTQLGNGSAQGVAAHLRKAVIHLPPGLRIDPSAAEGLRACSPAGIGLETPVGATPVEFTSDPAACPDAAKIGSAVLETPVLEEPLRGAVYLAQQDENPFGSLLALYVTAEDPVRGIAVKLAGRIVVDPLTGQLTVTFDENPQLPFERLQLNFLGGSRGLLSNPPTCGAYTGTADLTPWNSPQGGDISLSDSFQIGTGLSGGTCASAQSQAPNGPAVEAGAQAPIAGIYSPFALRLSRVNGSQRLRDLYLTLPPGLTGKLTGVGECSAAQLAAAAGRKRPGDGALERARPSCPGGSDVGSVVVAAGVGTPLYLRGRVYLAGPYKGAPLSLALIVPALAGPLDLGTVTVRVALYVNPRTAAIRVVPDSLPTILQGIPLDIRSLAVSLDRHSFTRNPTDCGASEVRGQSTSVGGQSAALSAPFQIVGCAGLDFKPRLSVRLLGSTSRGGHPRIRTVLRTRGGDANLRRVALTLPGTELLDSRHIKAVCTRTDYAARSCPRKSIYGQVTVWTPLLSGPLTGPVYLREGDRRLPDLIASLDGQIHLDLPARVDATRGRMRIEFDAIPDASLSKVVLTMAGGARGLFANTAGVCASAQRIAADLRSQAGKRYARQPALETGCRR